MAANDDRRQFIRLGAAGVASLLVAGALTRHSVLAQSSLSQGVQALPFDLEKNPQTVEPLNIDNKEWRKYLSDFEYYVLREEGTERAFTSPLNDEKRQGEFVCAGCGLLLFTSETKYDSGTGWPSFYDGITKNIGTSIDYKLFYHVLNITASAVVVIKAMSSKMALNQRVFVIATMV